MLAPFSGLPDTVLQKAAAKSRQFELSYGKRLDPKLSGQRWEDEATLIIENLIKIAASNDGHTLTDSSTVVCSLAGLQSRARLVLQQ